MNKTACVYFDGGYISCADKGLKGNHLYIYRALIKAIKNKEETVVTSGGDELPIRYR